MKSISDLQEIIEQELSNINIPKNPENLYKPIDYVIELGGKRMRPILVLIAHQLFDTDLKNALAPALGIINGVLVCTTKSLIAKATEEDTGPTNISTLSEEISFLPF